MKLHVAQTTSPAAFTGRDAASPSHGNDIVMGHSIGDRVCGLHPRLGIKAAYARGLSWLVRAVQDVVPDAGAYRGKDHFLIV